MMRKQDEVHYKWPQATTNQRVLAILLGSLHSPSYELKLVLDSFPQQTNQNFNKLPESAERILQCK